MVAAWPTVTGRTRLAGVIGDPVRHSLSPQIHNAAYEYLGLDWRYLALPIVDGHAAVAIDAMRHMDLAGLSVTMPHKAAVVGSLDALDPIAEKLGMVNCVSWKHGGLVGHNTDGDGLIAALTLDLGAEVAGSACAVIGAGGAAVAIVDALARNGASAVHVVNRTPARAERAASFAGTAGRVSPADAISDCTIVVNATPIGMDRGDDFREASPVPAELFGERHVVLDTIYSPTRTALLRDAASAGAKTANGVSMLVHVSALAFQLFTGVEAPVKIMRQAVAEYL